MSGQQLRYLPIHKLPDVTSCDVVLWDSFTGLHVTRPVLEQQAREWREDGVFTHFLLLPASLPIDAGSIVPSGALPT